MMEHLSGLFTFILLASSFTENTCGSLRQEDKLRNLQGRSPIFQNALQDIFDTKQQVKTTTLQYYQQLLQLFQNKKTRDQAAIRQSGNEDLTREEQKLIDLLKNIETQNVRQNQPHQQLLNLPLDLTPNINDISLIDLVYPQELDSPSKPTPIAEMLIQLQRQNQTNSNSYADIPYIPAVHGVQTSGFADTVLLASNSSTPQSDSQAATPPVRNSQSTRFGTTSLSTCLTQSSCILILAFLVAAGTTSALGIPLLFGKRKKRSTEDLQNFEENILSIVDHYHQQITERNNEPPIPHIVFQELSGIHSTMDPSDNRKAHQDSVNFVTDKEDGETLKPNLKETTNDETNEKFLGKRKLLEENVSTHRAETKPTSAVIGSKDEISTSKHEEPESGADEKSDSGELKAKESLAPSITHNPNLMKLNLGRNSNTEIEFRSNSKINSYDLPMEHRTIPEEVSTPGKETLMHKLRHDLNEYLNHMDSSDNQFNVSSTSNNQTETTFGNGTNYKNSILSTLNLILNNNVKKSSIRTPPQQPSPVISPETNVTPQELIKMLVQQSKPQQTTSNAKPQPFQTQNDQIQPSLTNNQNIQSLLKLLQQHNKQEQNQNNDNKNLNNLFKLAMMNQLLQNPTPAPVKINPPNAPLFQNPVSPAVDNSQLMVPVKTVSNILQNPNVNHQNLQSILSKLPHLISGQWRPPNSNAVRHPSFAPTVVQATEDRPSSNPIPAMQVTPASTPAKPGISDETRRFYSLLCKAILQPDIPLNRVTAYIAEKCLVMRFTGVLRDQ